MSAFVDNVEFSVIHCCSCGMAFAMTPTIAEQAAPLLAESSHYANPVFEKLQNLLRQALPLVQEWRPIETAPKDGYMLVHEDGAIRCLLRVKGVWDKTGYPAIISHPYNDVIVGNDANRLLPPGYRLELRDGCCDNPTHWMPLPPPPAISQSANTGERG